MLQLILRLLRLFALIVALHVASVNACHNDEGAMHRRRNAKVL